MTRSAVRRRVLTRLILEATTMARVVARSAASGARTL